MFDSRIGRGKTRTMCGIDGELTKAHYRGLELARIPSLCSALHGQTFNALEVSHLSQHTYVILI